MEDEYWHSSKKGRTTSLILCLPLAIQKNCMAAIFLCLSEVVTTEEEAIQIRLTPLSLPLSIDYSPHP